MSVPPPPERCPGCDAGAMRSTGQELDLPTVLDIWESGGRVSFRPEVRKHYEHPDRAHVTMLRCEHCGFGAFWPPTPGTVAFYEDVTAGDDYYLEERWDLLRAIDFVKQAGCRRVLDIGCGSGHFLTLAKRRHPATDWRGFEFGPKVAEEARQKGHDAYTGELPEVLDRLADEAPVDAVCMFHVLEHVADPFGLVRMLHEKLPTGGCFICSLPSAAGPLRHFGEALTDIPPHHVTRWTPNALRLGAGRCGFRTEKLLIDPLPWYLWGDYLPAIWEHDLRPRALGCWLLRRKLHEPLIKLLNGLGVKYLPGVTGMGFVALLRKG